jgi:hypothetical protein
MKTMSLNHEHLNTMGENHQNKGVLLNHGVKTMLEVKIMLETKGTLLKPRKRA